MRNHGICGIHKRRRPRWKRSSGVERAPADLVLRDLRPGAPDQTWAGDITYIPTAQGWLHLAVVLDIGSRKLIGHSMAGHTRAELVVDALHTSAAARGGLTVGVIFHFDVIRGARRFDAGHGGLTVGVIFHFDRVPQAGFNRSSQHLDGGGVCCGDDEGAAVGRESMDQPTTLRLNASSTTAPYTLPSRVGCSVMPLTHRRSGS